MAQIAPGDGTGAASIDYASLLSTNQWNVALASCISNCVLANYSRSIVSPQIGDPTSIRKEHTARRGGLSKNTIWEAEMMVGTARYMYKVQDIGTTAIGAAMAASGGRTLTSTLTTTITASSGSFITDGFTVGQIVTVSTALNSFTARIVTLTATVMTFAAGTVTNESAVSAGSITPQARPCLRVTIYLLPTNAPARTVFHDAYFAYESITGVQLAGTMTGITFSGAFAGVRLDA